MATLFGLALSFAGVVADNSKHQNNGGNDDLGGNDHGGGNKYPANQSSSDSMDHWVPSDDTQAPPCYSYPTTPSIAYIDTHMDVGKCIDACPLVALIAPAGDGSRFICACAEDLSNATSADYPCDIPCPNQHGNCGGISANSLSWSAYGSLTDMLAQNPPQFSTTDAVQQTTASTTMAQNPIPSSTSTSSATSSSSSSSPSSVVMIAGVAGAAFAVITVGMAVGIRRRRRLKITNSHMDFFTQVDGKRAEPPSSQAFETCDTSLKVIAALEDYPTLKMPALNALTESDAKISPPMQLSSLILVDNEFEIKKRNDSEDNLYFRMSEKHSSSGDSRDSSLSVTLLGTSPPQRKGLGAMPDRLRQNLAILSHTRTVTNSELTSHPAAYSSSGTTRESFKSNRSGSSSVYMNALQRNMERHAAAANNGKLLEEFRPEARADARKSLHSAVGMGSVVNDSTASASTSLSGAGDVTGLR
ncbi:hypothetical protein HDU82_006908 [Entophlyctis luteolus]|nr:hypothetical protein HDU82_006908 [Entophlyctis luteolus]